MNRKVLLTGAALAVATVGLGCVGTAAASETVDAARPASPADVIDTSSPIKHVVVIYQENHSFDDVLGQVCLQRSTPCDGYIGQVTFADGKKATNVVEPDVVPNVTHTRASQLLALANQWDKLGGCKTSPYSCVTHIDPSHIPNLAALADKFAVSDRTFAANPSQSFGAHVDLPSGTIDGFVGDNPVASKTGVKSGPGWGCPSKRDALWGNPATYVPSCIPDASGGGPYRSSPVPYVPTVMERLEAAGKTWHIYQGSSKTGPVDMAWSVCTYYYWCDANRFTTTYDSSDANFVATAKNGTLPNVSLLLPIGGNSQHNNKSMATGDNYIGQMVSAVENGPDWLSTAIFITYDDCGCFYDHVKPPAGLGLRNPMVIVSPWVRPGYTDSQTAVQADSMLSFIEHAFGLAPLNSSVTNAYDYGGSFNFSQTPLSAVHMVRSSISASEKRELARLPSIDDDPT